MAPEYFFIGGDGKVIPGVTILRDPQTGQLYDVVSVASGDCETPLRKLQATGERNDMAGESTSRERARRERERRRLNRPARVIKFPTPEEGPTP